MQPRNPLVEAAWLKGIPKSRAAAPARATTRPSDVSRRLSSPAPSASGDDSPSTPKPTEPVKPVKPVKPPPPVVEASVEPPEIPPRADQPPALPPKPAYLKS